MNGLQGRPKLIRVVFLLIRKVLHCHKGLYATVSTSWVVLPMTSELTFVRAPLIVCSGVVNAGSLNQTPKVTNMWLNVTLEPHYNHKDQINVDLNHFLL